VFNDWAQVLVGGNIRRFILNSEGTLFADSTGPIPVTESGAYLQAVKGIFDDAIKFTSFWQVR